jgi:cell division protein FtsQ
MLKNKYLNTKTTIRKVLFIAIWLCIGGGMVSLLLAAISNKNKEHCKGYQVVIKGAQNNLFIDQTDVEQLLMNSTESKIKGKLVTSFNLHELELVLEGNEWIEEAELYFDNRDVLHVTVIEKEPVARIFTTKGNSFYIDSAGMIMPLSEKVSARVPVFTGFPGKKELSSKDSLLLNDVRVTANFIVKDSFWMSQVAQMDIVDEENFEMIPVIGNHIVKLGNGENISEKFNRLLVFYKQVLSKTGFDKYKVIDVQYKGQVLASKSSGISKVDSVMLRKNIEKLLQLVKSDPDISEKTPVKVTEKYKIDVDSVSSNGTDLPVINPEKNSNPNPRLNDASPAISSGDGGGQAVKSDLNKTGKKENTKQKQPEKRMPKAVMPKKVVEDSFDEKN